MFKRALLAASVAVAISAPAMAEVTVYGSARTGIEYSKSADISRVRLIDENSRIGFMGSDKLGNGMTVFWKSEHAFRIGSTNANGTNDASSGWGARDQYVGVEGGFGTVSFGKQNDAYGDWINISPVLDGAMTNSEDSLFYQVESGSRKSNVAKYVSPKFSGFQASVAYDFGGRVKTGATNYDNHGYSALLTWGNDKFTVEGAYLGVQDYDNTPGEKLNSFAFDGVAKVTDALSLTAHWERAKLSQEDYKRDYFGAGAVYGVGKWAVIAQYLQANESKVAGVKQDDGAYQVKLGARYSLSKQTTAFAGVSYIDNDNNGAFGTATGVGGDTGSRAGTVSVSLRTDF